MTDDYFKSVITSNRSRLGTLIAEDFLFTLPDGTMLDRIQFLAWTVEPQSVSNLHVNDLNVRFLEDDLATVHASASVALSDRAPGPAQYTIVWARRSGRWIAVGAYLTWK